jgi:PEP-CTERM motif
MKTLLITLSILGGLSLTGTSQAALESRLGGQAVYDTVLDVTWLTNANLAATDSFGVGGINANGSMTWSTAQSWISAMDASNSGAGYLGYNDWRLPTTGPINGTTMNYNLSYNGSTDYGYNISAPGSTYAGSIGSEMAYLFYNDLGNKGYCDPAASTASTCSGPQAGWGLTNAGPFSNLQSNFYWSGTEYLPLTIHAWIFDLNSGIQYDFDKTNSVYVLAVRSGDVAVVPEPEAWGLMLSGLTLIGGVLGRRATC